MGVPSRKGARRRRRQSGVVLPLFLYDRTYWHVPSAVHSAVENFAKSSARKAAPFPTGRRLEVCLQSLRRIQELGHELDASDFEESKPANFFACRFTMLSAVPVRNERDVFDMRSPR
jgi:hypothetical protein